MRTVELRLNGEVFEVSLDEHEVLSLSEIESLLTEMWQSGQHRELLRLCRMFSWGAAVETVEEHHLERLREGLAQTHGLIVRRRLRPRIQVDYDFDAPVDLTTLSDEPMLELEPTVHYFECLVSDQEGDPIPGLECEVEGPGMDPTIMRTDEFGFIRLDDLPAAGMYRVTPLGKGSGGGGGKPPAAEDWFECKLIDATGEPIVECPCEVVTPEGIVHACESDSEGIVRLEALGVTGECELRLLEAAE